MNRLQKGFKAKLPKTNFLNGNTYFFLIHNSNRNFYSENNTIIHLHTKNTKKKNCKKRYYRL
jgi:hypothetical protein